MKKVAWGVVAALALGVVMLVKFAPDTARKLGLGFAVEASKARKADQKQTAWYTCSLNVNRDGPVDDELPIALACTVKQKTLLRRIKVIVAGKERNIVEEELVHEATLTPDKPWEHRSKLKIGGFGVSSDTDKQIFVSGRFFYPDQKLAGVIDDPRHPSYDLSRNSAIEEADERKHPEKYKLLLTASAEW
jgi:hypothetical protein